MQPEFAMRFQQQDLLNGLHFDLFSCIEFI
jgi:hypothetical protein